MIIEADKDGIVAINKLGDAALKYGGNDAFKIVSQVYNSIKEIKPKEKESVGDSKDKPDESPDES